MKKLLGLVFCITLNAGAFAQLPVLPYRTGVWNPDTLGNQRVIVRVEKAAPAVFCEIQWRRKDAFPQDKEILIYSQKNNMQVKNVIRLDISRESGKLVFEPIAGAGDYFIYYLPYKSSGGNYPKVNYLKPADRASSGWKEKWNTAKDLPKAMAVEMQSINALNSFYPMEVIATQKETGEYLSGSKTSGMVLFPEYREYPIRMWNDLPYRWISRGHIEKLSDTVQKGEYYSFQIGVLATRDSLKDLQVSFSDLTGQDGGKIPASGFRGASPH